MISRYNAYKKLAQQKEQKAMSLNKFIKLSKGLDELGEHLLDLIEIKEIDNSERAEAFVLANCLPDSEGLLTCDDVLAAYNKDSEYKVDYEQMRKILNRYFGNPQRVLRGEDIVRCYHMRW
jgi:hypothetical protein